MTIPSRTPAPLLVLIICATLLLTPPSVQATDYNLETCDGQTLVNILSTAANSSLSDTVTLKEGCTYTLTQPSSASSDQASGIPTITRSSGVLTIVGNGARIERSGASGTEDFRFFEVASSGTLILNNLTLANGSASDGGAIFIDGGAVTLRNVTMTSNHATGLGGGVANATFGTTGLLTVINSTLSGNNAGDSGGAIYSDGTLRMANSTISGNSATQDGGGIFHTASTANSLTLVQSTVAVNSAGRNGGGLYTGQSTTLHNSILADNTNGDCYKGGSPTITLTGVALVEDGSCGLTGAGYLNADPLLGPLANNGGLSFTHALLPHSPAIDAGRSLPNDTYDADGDRDVGELLAVDQRGLARVIGSAVDLGAFELQQPFITTVSASTADGTYDVSSTIDITVAFNQSVYVTGTPQLQLETGDSDGVASYTSGSGTATLTFTYTVGAGHANGDLDYTNTSALALNSGTIQASDGTAALLTLPEPGAVGSLSANKALVIATETVEPDPTVTIERAEAQGDPINTSPVLFTVVFSAPVSGFSSSGIDLSGSTTPGELAANITQAAPNDGTTYTISVSGMTADGQVVATVKAAAALSAAGKPNSASTSVDNTVTYDVTAPETTLTAAPPLITASNSATFTFSSEVDATFECSLNGATYAACTSLASYSALSDGDYTFAVRAVDIAGNADTTPASTGFTVDTTAPDTLLDSTPPAVTNASTPTFAFSSPDAGTSFKCRLDSGTLFDCATPYTTTSLTDGNHTFEVRAVDAAGNTDVTPAEHSFTVDTTAPTVEVTSSAANPTNASPIAVTISFSEPVSGFELTDLLIGNGSPGTLSSTDGQVFTVAITPTFDGTISVDIAAAVAQDAASNGNSALGSRFETVYDSTAPNTTITNPENNALINQRKPVFIFSADESGVTFTCTLNAVSFPCTSPYTNGNDLADRGHSFSVTARDAAGNMDASPASISFTVDTFAPEIYLGSKPSDPSRTGSVTIGFTSPESSATFECLLGSGEFAACSSPFRASLTDGRYTFYVRAVDLAGNRSIALSYSFTVDTTPPTARISEPADGRTTSNPTPQFVFSSADSGVTFTCRIDANAFAPCASPFTPAGPLADGEHTFDLQARDQAGNSSAASVVITIDTTAPDTTLDATPPAITASNEAQFTFSSSESGARFECSLDSAAFASCESPYATGALDDSEHIFQVRAIDSASNADLTPATFTFVIDTSAPETSLDSAPDGITGSSPTFTFSSPDNSAGFECKLDDGGYVTCASPYTTNTLQDGEHTFTVRAIDSAGLTDATPTSVTFTVDATAPTITSIRRVHADPTNRASVEFSVQFSESVTGVSESAFMLTTEGLTGAAITEVTGSGNTYIVTVTTGSGDGSLRLDVQAGAAILDASNQPLGGGYTSGETYAIVRSGPVVQSIVYIVDGSTLRFTVTFSAPVSGVDESDFALNTNGIDATVTSVNGDGASYTVVVTRSGIGTLALRVTDDDSIADEAGNPLGGEGASNGDYEGPIFDNRPHDHDDHDSEDRDDDSDVPTNSPPDNATASNIPSAVLLADMDDSSLSGVRAETSAGANVFGRVLVMDWQFYVNGGQIGNADVLARGVIAAVDIFSPDGSEVAGTRICLRGSGTLLLLDGRTSPREVLTLEAARDGDMTCGIIPAAGTVVLVVS